MSETNKDTKETNPITVEKGEQKPGALISNPFIEMEQAFDRFFRYEWPVLWRDNKLFEFESQRMPSFDVINRDNEIFVRAEIPGIEKQDLNISITDNLLTVKGKSSSEKKEEKGDYHRREISNFSFSRSVLLPGAVDESKTTASLNNGILEITLPKMETSKRKTIAVQ